VTGNCAQSWKASRPTALPAAARDAWEVDNSVPGPEETSKQRTADSMSQVSGGAARTATYDLETRWRPRMGPYLRRSRGPYANGEPLNDIRVTFTRII
jgi:hypothetical protein